MVNKLRKHMFFVTTLLVVFIFFGGFLLGRNIADSEIKKITEFIKENELNTESYLIEHNLIKEFGKRDCELASARIAHLFDELSAIGRRLEDPESIKKLGRDNFHFLKIKFHLMQIKTYTMFKKFIDNCNLSSNVILYYYDVDDKDCEIQGHILDKIAKDFNAKIFAIEKGYSDELMFLEDYYSISKTPALIINYEIKKEGLTSYDAIGEILK